MKKFDFSSFQNMVNDNGISMGTIMKSVLMAYVMTLIIFLIFSIVLTYTDFPESTIPTIVVVATIISIIFGAMRVSRRTKCKGWLNGSIVGVLYMIILYIISILAFKGFTIDRYVLYMLFLGLVTGAFGGIVGVNLKSNRKYKVKK